ncbi:hypothetical protein BFL38_05585 [Brachyspira hampsonii]|uniref:META domain-containing protein n=1 Tax=Brachyspira hampsonii TaxID=1287055 RepID=A0A1E5NDL4_9SPIR|nr:hypothetical protein [Brachyspira hampsonii]OEJ14243.1 hypothetical protein BFL38_05585 [Brachyspira hampsonii]
MNKKLLSILSILFLFSLLVISCSTKDTTGTGTPVDAKWHGTYEYKNNGSTEYSITVDANGILVFSSIGGVYITESISNSSLTKISDNNYKSGYSNYQYFEFTDNTLIITKSDNTKITLTKKTVQ